MSRHADLRLPLIASLLVLGLAGCGDELAESVEQSVTVDVVTTTDLGGFTDTADTGAPEGDVRSDASALDPSTPIPFVPCQTNTDCESGWCVETSEGRTCTRTCIEDCPGGWTCAAVGNVDTDITYICLPRNVNLCKPCRNDSECKSPGDPGTNTCVNYGPQGSFCAVDCSASACPDGYGCEGGQCVKSDGVCDCSWKAVKDAASTTCNASSELGTCYGVRTCLSGALSSCDAPAPAAETCNSADDDCDGLTDEALELGACTDTNDFGTCTGVTVCEDGTTVCTAKAPELEVCNGKDDDCDGLADEGFPDANADGLADCVSTDDDLDGVLDGTDNCPTIPNADQKDLDGDDIGDVCDGDRDGDGDSNDSDCAPDDAAVGSKQTEQCNGKDDNCSGTVDEGFANLDADTEADCVDADDDGDNIPDATDNCPYTANEDQSDLDGDGKGNVCENDLDGDLDPDGADCAPQDPSIHHGATEQCDGKDQNCNGIIDEGSPDSDLDAIADCLDTDDDGDGIVDEADNCPGGKNPDQLDTDQDGLGDGCDGDDDGDGTPDPLDCAPLDPTRKPGATESCNGKDDDCNGLVDEVGAQGCVERLYDGDGDGFGLSGVVLCTCAASFPYTTVEGGDCNDANSQVFPGATEACNAKDDDCNGIPDEPGSTGCLVRYEDLDSDSYGTTSACVCAGTTGYALLAGDCADDDPSRNPGADEVCDAEGVDENCNGAAGEQNAKGCTTWYFDGDSDAWGIATSSRCLCAAEGKYAAAVSGDCNDGNAAMAPTLAETCDLLDNNCNGQVDEGVMSPFYKDNDGDLYGGTSVKEACTAPIGYAPDAGDCNDYNPGIHPGATEVCDDLDGDCDGLVDEGLTLLTIYRDNDGDGFASSAAVATQKCNIPVGYTTAKDVTADGKSDWDCNDSNVVAYPKADEICDGADNDCDGIVDVQCPDACPGTWPYDVSIPHHTPIRLIDLDGDSIDELLVIDSTGKLTRVSPNGTGTAVCPSLTFSGAADARTSFTVNPALGNWKVHLVQGTRIWDLDACAEVKAAAGDLTGFGVVGDWDGDLALDYAGHLQVSASTCFKRAATWTTSCVASPSGKPWDGAMVVWELDGDGRDEVIAVRGRTFPGTTYYDGYTDIFGWNGTAMVIEASIAPPNASFVGSHLVAPTIADFGNDGYASLRLLAGNVLLDPVNLVGAGVFPTIDTVPLPQLADLDQDGDLEGAARGALVDLDGDGKPESISAAGNEITVRSADAQKLPLDGWPQLAGTFAWSVDVVVGDVNNDTRLEVYSPSVDGAVYCNRLGLGSANPERIIERGDANWLNRTNAKDPFEPSNTMARAWPLRFPTKEIRAYLTKGDVDYYRLPGVGGMMVQLVSPPGEDYDFELMNQDGTKVYTSGKKGVGLLDSSAICVGCNETPPPTYLVRVYPKDAAQHFSAGRPYVLRILTSP